MSSTLVVDFYPTNLSQSCLIQDPISFSKRICVREKRWICAVNLEGGQLKFRLGTDTERR